MSDKVVYIPVISLKPVTISLGVFKTEKKAYDYLATFLLKQNNYPNNYPNISSAFRTTVINVKKKYNINLVNKDILIKNLKTENDITDDLHDDLQYDIIETKIGELFYFVNYGEWDSNSLYETCESVLKGSEKIII